MSDQYDRIDSILHDEAYRIIDAEATRQHEERLRTDPAYKRAWDDNLRIMADRIDAEIVERVYHDCEIRGRQAKHVEIIQKS